MTHEARHDLESFFWSLAYIMMGYRNGIHFQCSETSKWHRDLMDDMYQAKFGFLNKIETTHKSELLKFSESLGVPGSAVFDFLTWWARELLFSDIHNGLAPEFEEVHKRLNAAIEVCSGNRRA